jgi:hypothetical protein
MRARPLLIFILLVIIALILVACGGKDEAEHETRDFVINEQAALNLAFDDPTQFETGIFDGDASLAIEGGQYIIRTSNPSGASYLWGTSNTTLLKNVVIETQATSDGGEQDNWFGVMCRVDDTNSGYAFLISADGFWSIAKADGQRGLEFLEAWQESSEIHKGDESNTIQAYCVDDYLALYVNGKFVGDHIDNSFNDVGAVGLLAGGAEGNEVEVRFENLLVQAAAFENSPNTPTSPAPSNTPTATATETIEPEPTQGLAPVTLQPIPQIGPAATTPAPQ